MRLALALASLTAVGCSSSPLADFESKLDRLYCQHMIDCGLYDPAYAPLCVAQQAAYDGVDVPLDVTFHGAASAGCLQAVSDALAAAPCRRDDVYEVRADPAVRAACEPALGGNVAPGANCARSAECAQSARCLYPGGGFSCAACIATKMVGQPCSGADCADGAYCAMAVCAAVGQAGASCQTTDACASGLDCLPSPTNSTTCQPPAASGMRCDPNLGHCADGLVCDSTMSPPLCAPPRQDGQSCNLDGDCAARLVCLRSTPPACHAPAGLGASCANTFDCIAPLDCFNGSCVPPKQIGDPCQTSDDCAIGWCDHTTGKCAAKLRIGATCDPFSSSDQCASHACNLQSHACSRCE